MSILTRRRGSFAAAAAIASVLLLASCTQPSGGGGGGTPTNQAPVASFTTTPASGTAPLAVDFDASASSDPDGTVASYEWNFGDGGTASGVTASHTFAQGSFTVTLLVTDDDGATDIETSVVDSQNDPPTAAFVPSTTSGAAPLAVSFDAAGSSDVGGSIVSYAWNFGDGDTDTGLNTAHTFDNGVFTVTLTVTDDGGGTDTATQVITVSNPAPVAAFNANPLSGSGPLSVSFDASASSDANGSIADYAWNFGDGDTGSGVTTSHVYANGTWTATLTVTDEDGSIDVATTVITASNQLPTASFTRTPASGNAPLAVGFNGTGSGDPDGTIVSYAWDFGDGGTATGATPNHTFNVGTWTITLTVTDNAGGTAATTRTVTVANTNPVASFSTTPASGNAPLSVSVNGSASSDVNGTIVSYGWNFGDGGTASGANANHIFGVGTFTVTLTVTDNHGGTGTTTRTVTSNNVAPVASFTLSPSGGAANLTVTANASGSTDTSGSITNYSWDFDTAWVFPGDLVSTASSSTTHVYTAGTYTARLTVTDSFGASSQTTRNITVTGTPAAPSGLYLSGSGCCDTYGDFGWNAVPGADAYRVEIDGYFLGGCVTDHGADQPGQRNSGRVQAVGLCLGSNYDAYIRARVNGSTWGPNSGTINFNL